MVSLQTVTRAELASAVRSRLAKMATMADDEDIDNAIFDSVERLDEVMYNPRSLVLNAPESATQRVDVTQYHIDEICNCWYAPSNTANVMFPELGFLPFLSSQSGVTCMESVVNYLQLQQVINMMNRQMGSYGDWELWPLDQDGKQWLQVQNTGLFRIEYLPHLNPDLDSWELYENERKFVTLGAFYRVNVASAEYMLNASALGVGKDASSTILEHWEKKLTDHETAFKEASIITYIQ